VIFGLARVKLYLLLLFTQCDYKMVSIHSLGVESVFVMMIALQKSLKKCVAKKEVFFAAKKLGILSSQKCSIL
jgi:hypothetical protein